MSFTSRWGDVWLAAVARAVSSCGDFLAATALALALQQAGRGGLAVSGLLIAASLPVTMLGSVAGRIADRLDSRRILVVTGLAQATVCVVLAYVGDPILIIGLVALLACGLAVTGPTLAALLPDMVGKNDLARAGGLQQSANMIGLLAAPALAGILVGRFGLRVPLLLDAFSYLALVAAGMLLRTRRRGASAGDAPRVGAWRLRADPLVFVMVVAVATAVAGVSAINVVELFFIRETLAASTTMFGLIAMAWSAGMLVGALAFGQLGGRWSDPAALVRGVLALLAGTCLPVLAGAGVSDAALLLPLWVAGGFCNGGINVLIAVVFAHRVPAAARGRAFAVLGAAVQGANLGGFLLGGVLVGPVAPRILMVACGVAGLVAVLGCLPAVRRAARPARNGAGVEIASET
ncbi:MFS transporter [Mangrovihabitans endophyticus]|uniref:Major facilitator superfamily (MFS) profile domain-containing protein n=1 Tax=Mangrovihabitans endophyticus TaxID=1751298 RepID=A0A8J3C222_9ACTN|nr:MFS transporter [Mangrovihabitans endophyticus]GGK97091.1 hypothetical protein GCM10012284_34200 [Mangrovihabitans endophyticus]